MVTGLDYNGVLWALQGILGEPVAVAIIATGGAEVPVAFLTGALHIGKTLDKGQFANPTTTGVSFYVMQTGDDDANGLSVFHLAEAHFVSAERSAGMLEVRQIGARTGIVCKAL